MERRIKMPLVLVFLTTYYAYKSIQLNEDEVKLIELFKKIIFKWIKIVAINHYKEKLHHDENFSFFFLHFMNTKMLFYKWNETRNKNSG